MPKDLKRPISILDGEGQKCTSDVIEWERNAMNVKDLLPYINTYIHTDGNVNHLRIVDHQRNNKIIKASKSKAKIKNNFQRMMNIF